MISQYKDPLSKRDRLIIQAILKQVENHDLPTENIITFYINEVGEVDGQLVKTVVVVTTYSLYSFGYEYFKQLAQEIRHQLAIATISELVTPTPEKICQCPHCVDGCSYCGYTSLVAEGRLPYKPDSDEYRFLLHSPDTYSVYIGDTGETCYGLIQRVRNKACIWENDEETYYYLTGDGERYTGAIHAADALLSWIGWGTVAIAA